MASCSPSINSFIAADGSMEVVEKYKLLMQATLSDESIYTRAKDTYFQLFKDLQLTEKEKAQIVAENITTMALNISNSAMGSAVTWAKEERDGDYTLAKVKAETELVLAQQELTAEQICKMQKETELECAKIEATIAASIRENGRASTYKDVAECRPETLYEEGLKYHQQKLVEGQTVQVHSDSFRKSGVVTLGTDSNDNVYKGLSGDDDGNTNEQTKFTTRQTIAFEDSKRNHALNGASQTIGQMLSAEIPPENTDNYMIAFAKSMDYLTKDYGEE